MDFKKIFKRHGYTVTELAEKLGISQPALSRMIGGNPTLDNLSKIADTLGIPLSELFSDGDELCALLEYKGKTYSAHSFKELDKVVSKLKEN